MAVNLSPYGGVGAQFLDNSGNVLTGGKIFTYAGGTTTPQATYTSSNGRLLRHAQLGHVSLRTLRRMRVPTGSLVPSGVAETLAALVLVWVGASCHDALRRAAMPGG